MRQWNLVGAGCPASPQPDLILSLSKDGQRARPTRFPVNGEQDVAAAEPSPLWGEGGRQAGEGEPRGKTQERANPSP
jgi:hypothetical protein